MANHDTDPAPVNERERTPRDSGPGGAFRSGLATFIRKLTPYVITAAAAMLLWVAAEFQRRLGAAEERADTAQATAKTESKKSVQVAETAREEAAASYDVTKEKVDETGKVIAELVAEVKAMREELEKMKRGAKPKPRRPRAVKVPPVVTQPLPESPAAAAQAAAPPGGE